jgi:hypothetical protein
MAVVERIDPLELQEGSHLTVSPVGNRRTRHHKPTVSMKSETTDHPPAWHQLLDLAVWRASKHATTHGIGEEEVVV